MPLAQKQIIFNFYFESRKKEKKQILKEDPNTFTFRVNSSFNSQQPNIHSAGNSIKRKEPIPKANSTKHVEILNDEYEGNTFTINAITLDNTDEDKNDIPGHKEDKDNETYEESKNVGKEEKKVEKIDKMTNEQINKENNHQEHYLNNENENNDDDNESDSMS